MKLRFLLLNFLILTVVFNSIGALNISGTRTIKIDAPASSGLESVYVVESAGGATLNYEATSSGVASAIKWYKFNSSGGGFAEPITNVSITGSVSSISISSGDSGYIAEVQGRQYSYWIVDYITHLPSITSFSVNSESDCSITTFTADGGFDKIVYYSITGAPIELNRQIVLEYYNEVFSLNDDNNTGSWDVIQESKEFSYISGSFYVMAPYCDTQFRLSGDRFLKAWGKEISVITNIYQTKSVSAVTYAIQDERDNPNEQKNSSSGLGGSAPVDITFKACPTEAVVFREWQFSHTEDFEDVIYRFNEDEFTYTFHEFGTTYVRYICADATGECTFEGDIYTIAIGESKLLCPNAFSPHNEDGVNDEWKVSYSSLVKFECHIFNRWGKELYSSTNPAEGWDGKIGGKFVPSGVYFYVIKAEGADGVKYNLSGDINIVGSKLKPSNSEIE